MRSVSLFILILVGVTLAAAQQPQYKKPKAKPYHSESKHSEQSQGKGSVSDKKLTPHSSNSQELRHVEQQTAKTAKSSNAEKRRARSARVVKTQHEKNPPIHFSSAGGTKTGTTNQGKNPYKGRVRQKGSNKR
jgi:hypothetical protein